MLYEMGRVGSVCGDNNSISAIGLYLVLPPFWLRSPWTRNGHMVGHYSTHLLHWYDWMHSQYNNNRYYKIQGISTLLHRFTIKGVKSFQNQSGPKNTFSWYFSKIIYYFRPPCNHSGERKPQNGQKWKMKIHIWCQVRQREGLWQWQHVTMSCDMRRQARNRTLHRSGKGHHWSSQPAKISNLFTKVYF